MCLWLTGARAATPPPPPPRPSRRLRDGGGGAHAAAALLPSSLSSSSSGRAAAPLEIYKVQASQRELYKVRANYLLVLNFIKFAAKEERDARWLEEDKAYLAKIKAACASS